MRAALLAALLAAGLAAATPAAAASFHASIKAFSVSPQAKGLELRALLVPPSYLKLDRGTELKKAGITYEALAAGALTPWQFAGLRRVADRSEDDFKRSLKAEIARARIGEEGARRLAQDALRGLLQNGVALDDAERAAIEDALAARPAPAVHRSGGRDKSYFCTKCDGEAFKLSSNGQVDCAGCGARMKNLRVEQRPHAAF